MSGNVIVEFLNASEDVWEKDLLSVPSILSSPTLNCRFPVPCKRKVVPMKCKTEKRKKLNITQKRKGSLDYIQTKPKLVISKHSSRLSGTFEFPKNEPLWDPYDDLNSIENPESLAYTWPFHLHSCPLLNNSKNPEETSDQWHYHCDHHFPIQNMPYCSAQAVSL